VGQLSKFEYGGGTKPVVPEPGDPSVEEGGGGGVEVSVVVGTIRGVVVEV
jgi:hypothetical protein